MSSPFINPGVPPIQPTPGPTEGPKIGPETTGRPFDLPTKGGGVEEAGKPTPMEASREKPGGAKWSSEEMIDKMDATKQKFAESQVRLSGPEGQKLTKDHESALTKLTHSMDKDLRSIAERTQGKYAPPATKQGQSVVEKMVDWLDGAQGAMSEAMAFKPKVGVDGNIDPSQFLRLQYSVQRASQRAEIFSSVIGSTVSGIKTLMSTQLG